MSKKFDRIKRPAIITSVVLVLPVIFLAGWAIGQRANPAIQVSPDSISSWISATSTVAIALLTFILAKETWYLRLAQANQLSELKTENIRPNVNVQLEPSRVGLNFVDVHVSNLGRGIARKVKIELVDELGNRIPESVDPVVEKFRKLAIFSHGIETMGIGQVISSFVFSFFELGSELKGEVFKPVLRFAVTFQDIAGKTYSTNYVIDFAQYEGLSELGGGDPLHLLSEDLKKIRLLLEKITRADNRLGVNVFDSKDRSADREYLNSIRKSAKGEN